jgi:hypothetical protein
MDLQTHSLYICMTGQIVCNFDISKSVRNRN